MFFMFQMPLLPWMLIFGSIIIVAVAERKYSSIIQYFYNGLPVVIGNIVTGKQLR